MSQAACTVEEVISFPEYITYIHNVQPIEVENENQVVTNHRPLGGISKDCSFSWLSNGPHFEVVKNIRNNFSLKIAAWVFGALIKDPATEVVCCKELPQENGKVSLLLVGINSKLTGGMICVFNMAGSNVFRAIHIGRWITSMELVDADLNASSMFGPLQTFDGVLAVGTENGSVLLIDICRQICDDLYSQRAKDYDEIRDEVKFCNLEIINYVDPSSLENHKVQALNEGKHLAIELNFDATSGPHFSFMGPKGKAIVMVNKQEVAVSSLHYCPQLNSLLVGFNFGGFQLWNLITLKLEYSSPIFDGNVPVSHFALQEPADDPKAYAYIWVVYSYTSYVPNNYPIAVLYSIVYETKEWREESYFYEGFKNCSFRFQMELTSTADCELPQSEGAVCLSMKTISKSPGKGTSCEYRQDLPDDSVAVCAISWTVYSVYKPHSHTYLALFDLNQWYKEQMPSTAECADRYLAKFCLSELFTSEEDGIPVLDVTVDSKTVKIFNGAQRLEEHYYPSSLSFKCCVLRTIDSTWIECQGVQRALLSQIEKAGPLALLRPEELYEQCISVGLTPLFTDTPSHLNNVTSLTEQREFLLNVALEQQRFVWLCKCAKAWSDGSYSSIGCSLEFVLNWAWQRAAVLKSNADSFCVPLFDYSGTKLDYNSSNLLNNCTRQLKHLHTLFETVIKDCKPFLADVDIAEQRCESLFLVSSYLDVLRWLINVGLLPECPVTSYPRRDESDRIYAPYPAESLTAFYESRRQKLAEFCEDVVSDASSTPSELLFIDNLIMHDCRGEELSEQWKKDGGSGLYPPKSLQALLRIYLLEGVPIMHKHRVLTYFFLDLAMALNDKPYYGTIHTYLIKFPTAFQIDSSIIKITQAFWHLDHGDFDTAMQQLWDPLVKKQDLKLWQHRNVVEAMVKQHQYKHALIYLQVIQPPLHDFEDICTTITLHLANEMLHQGFNYLRQHTTADNEVKLLDHFFNECKKQNCLRSVNSFLLSPLEEAAYMKFLEKNEEKDLQVAYYIQRSRFMEAYEISQHKFGSVKKQGLLGQEQKLFQDLLIEDFYNSMPEVSKDLFVNFRKQPKNIYKQMVRPEPLSVTVHKANEPVRYKSSFIEAAMAKAKETWTQPSVENFLSEQGFSPKRSGVEEIPFLRTPTASGKRLRAASPIIQPTALNPEDDECTTNPTKRFRLSARQSLIKDTSVYRNESLSNTSGQQTPNRLSNLQQQNSFSYFDTPIVKRKRSSSSSSSTAERLHSFIGTPQSILKVRSLVQSFGSPSSTRNTPTPENLDDIPEDTSDDGVLVEEEREKSLLVSSRVTPRRSLSRTPHIVRFQGISRSSSSLNSSLNESIPKTTILSISLETSKKDSTASSTSEAFYSPEVSTEENKSSSVPMKAAEVNREADAEKIRVDIESEIDKQANEEISFLTSKRDVKYSPRTPQCRKTYKEVQESSPTRSSPRLRQKDLSMLLKSSKSILNITESPSGSATKTRKSLSRQVLENNTFNKTPLQYAEKHTKNQDDTEETQSSTESYTKDKSVDEMPSFSTSYVTSPNTSPPDTSELTRSEITKRTIEIHSDDIDTEESDKTIGEPKETDLIDKDVDKTSGSSSDTSSSSSGSSPALPKIKARKSISKQVLNESVSSISSPRKSERQSLRLLKQDETRNEDVVEVVPKINARKSIAKQDEKESPSTLTTPIRRGRKSLDRHLIERNVSSTLAAESQKLTEHSSTDDSFLQLFTISLDYSSGEKYLLSSSSVQKDLYQDSAKNSNVVENIACSSQNIVKENVEEEQEYDDQGPTDSIQEDLLDRSKLLTASPRKLTTKENEKDLSIPTTPTRKGRKSLSRRVLEQSVIGKVNEKPRKVEESKIGEDSYLTDDSFLQPALSSFNYSSDDKYLLSPRQTRNMEDQECVSKPDATSKDIASSSQNLDEEAEENVQDASSSINDSLNKSVLSPLNYSSYEQYLLSPRPIMKLRPDDEHTEQIEETQADAQNMEMETSYKTTETVTLATTEGNERIKESKSVYNVEIKDVFKSTEDGVTHQHKEETSLTTVTKVHIEEEVEAIIDEENQLNRAATTSAIDAVINILDSSAEYDEDQDEDDQDEDEPQYADLLTAQDQNLAECEPNFETSENNPLEQNVFELDNNSSPTLDIHQDDSLGFVELESESDSSSIPFLERNVIEETASSSRSSNSVHVDVEVYERIEEPLREDSPLELEARGEHEINGHDSNQDDEEEDDDDSDDDDGFEIVEIAENDVIMDEGIIHMDNEQQHQQFLQDDLEMASIESNFDSESEVNNDLDDDINLVLNVTNPPEERFSQNSNEEKEEAPEEINDENEDDKSTQEAGLSRIDSKEDNEARNAFVEEQPEPVDEEVKQSTENVQENTLEEELSNKNTEEDKTAKEEEPVPGPSSRLDKIEDQVMIELEPVIEEEFSSDQLEQDQRYTTCILDNFNKSMLEKVEFSRLDDNESSSTDNQTEPGSLSIIEEAITPIKQKRSYRRKSTEPSDRVLRRSSLSVEDADSVNNVQEVTEGKEESAEPAKRRRLRSGSTDLDAECVDTPKEDKTKQTKKQKASVVSERSSDNGRRAKSEIRDTVSDPAPTRRLRSNSYTSDSRESDTKDTDKERKKSTPGKRNKRTVSVSSSLPVIAEDKPLQDDEESQSKQKAERNTRKMKIEEYSTARRLTRRQKNIMEQSLTDQGKLTVDSEVTDSELMKSDTEEMKAHMATTSPDSDYSDRNTEGGSITTRSRARKCSESDVSSDIVSPAKRPRRRIKTGEKVSEEMASTSAQSVKKLRKRSNTMDSDKSDVSVASNKSSLRSASRASSRSMQPKVLLEKIAEESNSSDKTTSSRVTRSRAGSHRSVTPERVKK